MNVGKVSPSISLEKDVVYEDFDHSLQNSFLPHFPLKVEDVINDDPSQEIIVETLCCEMMVMWGYQPMTPMLCEITHYPLLEESDEHT